MKTKKLNLLTAKKCLICGSTEGLEKHHIFDGCRRNLSEKYGLKVYLCRFHHRDSKFGVHGNKNLAEYLHTFGQRKFTEFYPEIDFMQTFGKNYDEKVKP